MFWSLGNKTFCFLLDTLSVNFRKTNAYNFGETELLRNVKRVPRSSIGTNTNVIGIHVMYKLKRNDDKNSGLNPRQPNMVMKITNVLILRLNSVVSTCWNSKSP